MATLIPDFDETQTAFGAGERHFAQRLREMPDDTCLCWHKAPIGAGGRYPDFIVLDPRHGLLVLQVRDWKIEQLRNANTLQVQLDQAGETARLPNPLHEARAYARALARVLGKDPLLLEIATSGAESNYGLVLTEISRDELHKAGLHHALSGDRILCKDDLALPPELFGRRLSELMGTSRTQPLSASQMTRIRHLLFPDVRVRKHDRSNQHPNTLDVTQETIARRLGNGHRVIHGVAGSGKTLLLVQRCRQIAKTSKKPVLVLCVNPALATRLEQLIDVRIPGRVVVRDFHRWCLDQLRLHDLEIPKASDGFPGRLVRAVAKALSSGKLRKHQYDAVMIDEGHDFEPEWLQIIMQTLDPRMNSLLLLYDDAQAIYGKKRSRHFSFAKVGIQARGRTSILRVNYRNSAEVLKCAYDFAENALKPEDDGPADDMLPFVVPETAGRRGRRPLLKMCNSLADEVTHIATQLRALHEQGHAWKDMAVLYPARFIGEEVTKRFKTLNLPLEWLQDSEQRFNPDEDSIKAMTLHASKGLEFPIVAIAGIGFMPYREDEDVEDARLLYVGMTRASEQLILTAHKRSEFVKRLTGDPGGQARTRACR